MGTSEILESVLFALIVEAEGDEEFDMGFGGVFIFCLVFVFGVLSVVCFLLKKSILSVKKNISLCQGKFIVIKCKIIQ